MGGPRVSPLARSLSLALLGLLVGSVLPAADDHGLGFVVPEPLSPDPAPLELQLVHSLMDIRDGRLDEALDHAAEVTRRRPDFSLAQLVYGDVLSALTDPLAAFGQAVPPAAVSGLRDEARARLGRYLEAPPAGAVPGDLLRLPPGTGAALLIDLERYRLFVYEQRDGRLVQAADYYVSIGKGGVEKRREGDEKTPVGVYLVSSYLPGDELPDLYGVGAFPLTYPNGWDLRRGRTGSGIWIHGTESDRYSRPPKSSRGCVTLSNADFDALGRRVEVSRTPVVVGRSLEWVAPEVAAERRRALEAAIESWRRDWESRDAERYLSHYAADFQSGGMDRAGFAAHKRRVNAGKRYIRVDLDEIGIYSYPGEPDLVLVDFVQSYASDDFRARRRKHQYWRLEDGAWRIVLETGA